MKSNKYKILVLSDLTEKSSIVLDYATKLSKEIDADIEFFYAKEATKVIGAENAFDVLQTINESKSEINNQITSLVTPILSKNKVVMKTAFGYGHVKNEIKNYITTSAPDMIILGERKPKALRFLGNDITRFVQSNYDGVVFIATKDNTLDTQGNISLNNLGLIDNLSNFKVKDTKKAELKSQH
ncbi:MAG: universal stress protein [Psychroserpens sp.]|uniref:universal stress protein n=1 Tax=Psychroserpens sp. TaxID=2020870 RepID=UPI003C7825F4